MINERKTVHKLFQISVILKGLDGVLELIGGIFLLIIAPSSLTRIAKMLLRGELIEDPGDLIANLMLKIVSGISANVQIFSALYLLIHGIIKIGLMFALLYRKLWAYPLSEVIFILFAISQLYAYYYSHSLLLIILTILDIFVVILVWMEYKNLRKSFARENLIHA